MNRRRFLLDQGKIVLLLGSCGPALAGSTRNPSDGSHQIRLALCGDVMTGRGVDQILPRPSDPRLHESYVKSATRYVEIAQSANGPFPTPVDFAYPWGDALPALKDELLDARIVNLETAVTVSNDYWRGKGINYRMHPENVPCLEAAGIDCCVLANNHVLDWGYGGLDETLTTLDRVRIATAGAGANLGRAAMPAVMNVGARGRVLVFAFASPTAGVPRDWAATEERAGVRLLRDLSENAVRRIKAQIDRVRREKDLVVVSIHWGSNWGYDVPDEQQTFAHWLIDEAGVNIVHGHSSHHPKGIEIYKDRPIFYGCGDFLNDYEGISGYESYRDDLVLMYNVTMESSSGRLVRLEMLPFKIERFTLNHVSSDDAAWLGKTMTRQCAKFGGRINVSEAGAILLETTSEDATSSRHSSPRAEHA